LVADPGAEAGDGGGAEAFDPAGGQGGLGSAVGVVAISRSSESTWAMSLILLPWRVTAFESRSRSSGVCCPVRVDAARWVMMRMAVILRTPRGLVSPLWPSWWARVATRVWKSLRVGVSPEMVRWLVPV
jgi:hypothetical protein